MSDSFSAVYDKGHAVGNSNVRDDTMTFRYREEVFDLPTRLLHGVSNWNGLFYQAKVEDLRRIAKELEQANV